MTSTDETRALRLMVLGALTIAGKELVRGLTRARLPLADVALVGSADQEGTITELAGEPAVVHGLSDALLADIDAVVCCGDAQSLVPHLPQLRKRGVAVIDLTGELAGSDEGAVALPGLARAQATIRWLPHPLLAVAVPVLRRLAETSGLLRAELVGFMPVAEAGEPGIDELYAQTVERLSFREGPTEALGARLAFDVVLDEPGARRALESRIRAELAALLGDEAPGWSATVLRVPVFLGVGCLLTLELDQELPARAVAELLEDEPTLLVRGGPVSPGALEEQVEDDEVRAVVSVLDGDAPGRVRLWTVADLVRTCRVAPTLGLVHELTRG